LGCGVSPTDPRLVKSRSFFQGRKRESEGGLYVVGMDSTVWNTGLALRSITAAGVPDHSEFCMNAAAALERLQILHPPTPRVFQPKPDAPRRGGWAFTAHNSLQADTDDTGVALAALAQLQRAGLGHSSLVKTVNLGVEWLLGMQNRDGGWAAFAYGLPSKRPGALDSTLLMNPPETLWGRVRLFVRKPAELGDPSTAGLTGRVMFALGQLGFSANDPEIERAIDFLRDQQDDRVGGWFGAWMVNYLPATACVLSGLAAVEAELDRPWIQRAVRFLLDCQNEDGGWGETAASYLDVKAAGQGKSMPALTGMVTCALIDIGLG